MSARDTDPKLDVAFLYPGQGGQSFHMARNIYRSQARFRSWMNRLDSLLVPRIGTSVLRHLYDENFSSAVLDDVMLSHPAIFMVEYALSRVLMEEHGPPAYLLAGSLGELVAAAVSEAMSLEHALDIVTHHARVLSSGAATGGMLAVVAEAEFFEQRPEIFQDCEIATYADGSHFVVSATTASLQVVQSSLMAIGVPSVCLPVLQAFHSSIMDNVKGRMAADLDVAFAQPKIPIISCVTGCFLTSFSAQHIWRTIRAPVQIGRAVTFLRRQRPRLYIDLGPGSMFASYLMRRRPVSTESKVLRILGGAGNDVENFAKVQLEIANGSRIGWR